MKKAIALLLGGFSLFAAGAMAQHIEPGPDMIGVYQDEAIYK